MPTDGTQKASSAKWQLALGTISFAVCFAAWGLISAFAPRFRESFHLSATETAFLVAVPVLLGSLMRIVTGMLADRFGGRLIFTLLMMTVAVPAFLVPRVGTYQNLLVVGFFLGIAGSSFAVGVGFVSRWFPPDKQGGALGVYGLGNIGQSVAVFLGPVLGAIIGWQNISAALGSFSLRGESPSAQWQGIRPRRRDHPGSEKCLDCWHGSDYRGCSHFSTF